MDRKQLAAAMALGGLLAVGGEHTLGRLAEAAALPVTSHAVDLRRDARAPERVSVKAWGSQGSVDAGFKDVGPAKACKSSATVQRACGACMDAVDSDCAW